MGVFTHIDEENLKIFLKSYNFTDINSFTGINEGIQNTNYKIKLDLKDFILTIYENIDDENDINFFLNLMNHLSSRGIKCPIPLKNSSSKMIGKIKAKPAALLTFLSGKSVTEIREIHTYQIGKALAELHLGGKNFKQKKRNELSISGWQKLLIKNKNKLNKLESKLFNKIKDKIIEIERNWPKNLPSGIIHADLFPDNVLFTNNKVTGLIDFYFSCNDFFVYDLSICINAWCFNDNNKFIKGLFLSLIKGYEAIRPLSVNEINSIPILCYGSSLRFLLTRVDNWNNNNELDIVNYQDPSEFLKKFKFHESNKDTEAYNI